jgi:predicted SAM-dependent methyltransferase
MLRLHIGCGDVYLKDWVNIDVYREEGVYFAGIRSDLRDENLTTMDKYYKHNLFEGSGNCVIDAYADASHLPYSTGEVDSILTVQVAEHFSRAEVVKVLAEWYRVLRSGGQLFVDVPDLMGILKMLIDAVDVKDDEWVARLLYGSHKNRYSCHSWGYTPRSLSHLLKTAGFANTKEVSLIEHAYPAFMLMSVKP